jgi:hypothetical protein
MFFLLRMAFWLTIVLALLPAGGSQPVNSAPQIDAAAAVIAAGAAVSDVTSFCDRQPGACKVGAQAAAALGQRAQAGAGMVYDFINDRMISDRTARSETGSVPAAKLASTPKPVPVLMGSQSTLTPVDLEPAWQGSGPRQDNVPLPRPRTRRPA